MADDKDAQTREIGKLRLRVFSLTEENKKLKEENQQLIGQNEYCRQQLFSSITHNKDTPPSYETLIIEREREIEEKKQIEIEGLRKEIQNLQDNLKSTFTRNQVDEIIKGKEARYNIELENERVKFRKEKEELQSELQNKDERVSLKQENEQLQETLEQERYDNEIKLIELKGSLKKEQQKSEEIYSQSILERTHLKEEIKSLQDEIDDLKRHCPISPPHNIRPLTTPKFELRKPHPLREVIVEDLEQSHPQLIEKPVQSCMLRQSSEGEEEKEIKEIRKGRDHTQSENVMNKEFGKLQRDFARLKQEFDREMKLKAELERKMREKKEREQCS